MLKKKAIYLRYADKKVHKRGFVGEQDLSNLNQRR